jgi:uncharacterized OB-fold protein
MLSIFYNLPAPQRTTVLDDRTLVWLERVLLKQCDKCGSVKVSKSHHCSTCESCIA